MDGLDMSLVDISLGTDYSFEYRIIESNYEQFDSVTVELINKTIKNTEYLDALDFHLGKLFCDIVDKYYSKYKIDAISMHGQTVKHIEKKQSIQSGNPKFLYQRFNVPIIYNFRHADIVEGGNGAPLMPFLDWLLFRNYSNDVVTLNIGGISNISFIKQKCDLNDVIGFDTGPGMSLIDEFTFLHWNMRYDRDGLLAENGKINKDLLSFLMKNSFINRIPPKSTGRDQFGLSFVNDISNKFQNVDRFDMLRTLVRFTAESIILNIDHLKKIVIDKSILIISGGGINNKLLIRDIIEISDFKDVITSHEIGINPDYKESLLMGVLGLGRMLGLDTNVPSVTGARKFVSCGDIYGEL